MEAKMSKQEKQSDYDAWFIAEVEKGIEDADAGRLTPHDVVMKRLKAHVEKVAKNAKKAA